MLMVIEDIDDDLENTNPEGRVKEVSIYNKLTSSASQMPSSDHSKSQAELSEILIKKTSGRII